jgi:hypothetical protein
MSAPQIPQGLKDLAAQAAQGKKVTPEEIRQAASKVPVPGVSKARVMPTLYKGGIIKIEWFRKFTWRERFAIFFGANFVLMIGVACKHNVGSFQPMVVGKCSKNTTPDNEMKEAIENMAAPENHPVHQMAK